MNKRLWVPALLITLAALSWWYVRSLDKDLTKKTEVSAQGPDFYMRDVLSTVMDDKGMPKHQLHTQYLAHYPEENRTDLRTPHLTLYQPNGNIWTIRSEKGEVFQETEEIYLLGEVIIEQPGAEEQRAIKIVTKDVMVDPNAQTAETQMPVAISHIDGNVNAVGMRANLKKQTVMLKSEVRGTYAPSAK
ncbi:LPS export ABC transporter periplasmic protein LptC [Kaarinaea lacus]